MGRKIDLNSTNRRYAAVQPTEFLATDVAASRLRDTLQRIQAAAGLPDAAEACRTILALAAEALAESGTP